MKKIQLSMIEGIHPEIARFEQELDLAPIEVPDARALHTDLVKLRCRTHPLVLICRGDRYYCVGEITWYRWLAAHMPNNFEVDYLVISELDGEDFKQISLLDRIFAPQISRITDYQVKVIYEYLKENNELWPNDYKSNADLSNRLGVKPLKSAIRKRVGE